MRALTVKQPWADLIMAGVKDVENRSWPVPSTLPQWRVCSWAGHRYRPNDPSIWEHDRDCGSSFWQDAGPFPFRLGIHAGRRMADADDPVWALWHDRHRLYPDAGVLTRSLVLRHLLGFVTVTGCHSWRDCEDGDFRGLRCCSPWAQSPEDYDDELWHWTLADPEPLSEPIPMKGRLGLWSLDGQMSNTPELAGTTNDR